jgi:hypothetical protein
MMVEWLTLLLHIREILGSNLGLESGYSDRFFVVSSVPPGECQGSSLKLGHNRFLSNLFHQFFISVLIKCHKVN